MKQTTTLLLAFALSAPTMAHNIVIQPERGRMLSLTAQLDGAAEYYLYVPRTVGPRPSLFVTVHGISRNAKEHITYFKPYADRYGVILVAPYFSAQKYPGYQRLRANGKPKSDLILDQILSDVGRRTGARTDKLYFFGFSGGGQFVHRYTMAHPDRVAAAVLGAPGWYTFPTRDQEYPLGIKGSGESKGIAFDPLRFLQVPMKVVVGEKDIERDPELRAGEDIDRMQGRSRLERGVRWIESMSEAAASHGFNTDYEFEILPQCDHDFVRCMKQGQMGDVVFRFLLGSIGSLPASKDAVYHEQNDKQNILDQ